MALPLPRTADVSILDSLGSLCLSPHDSHVEGHCFVVSNRCGFPLVSFAACPVPGLTSGVE